MNLIHYAYDMMELVDLELYHTIIVSESCKIVEVFEFYLRW